MSEPYPFPVQEEFIGPEAPSQTLVGAACDILAHVGEDMSTEQLTRLYAKWDDAEGHTLHLHKLSRDGKDIFRLMVLSPTESEPVANYRYVVGGIGTSMHDVHSKQIADPSRENDRAMFKYLKTADVAWRNGVVNELVNSVFWQIAVDSVLSDPEVTRIQESMAANAPADVRYDKQSEAEMYVLGQSLSLPESVLHQALEGVFFPPQTGGS